jgi:hypothetical protein
MNFFKNLFTQDTVQTLNELIEKNSEKGIYRKQIIEKLKQEKLFVGVNQLIPNGIIDSNTKNIKCLTSTDPDNKGEVLLLFVNESNLRERNRQAIPVRVNIEGIKTIINNAPGLIGLIIIGDSGWIYFPNEHL